MPYLRVCVITCALTVGTILAATPEFAFGDGPTQKMEFFERRVAPLLAKHCLECHSASNDLGGLNLAQKQTAMEGGDSGPAVVPNDLNSSLLWEYVRSDEMPKKRSPLSSADKKVLKQWIEDGATWNSTQIEPSLYLHADANDSKWVRRLTTHEYIGTVKATFGVEIATEAHDILPPELRADGFQNTAYNLNVDLKHIQAYDQLAEIIVEKLDVPKFARRFSSSKKLTDNSMRGLIKKMGQWVLRGPLQDHEIDAYRGITTTTASSGGGFEEAISLTLRAMAQSPRFVYRIEQQSGPSKTLDDFQLASRLSYAIWGTSPDQELMRLAESKKLRSASTCKQQIQRMLGDPRAKLHSIQFVDQWLNLGRLENLRPDAKRFPKWDSELAADMRRETTSFSQHVLWEKKESMSKLLDAEFTYLTPKLARHYGIKAQPEDFVRYDLSHDKMRGGLLTQGSVLTIGGDEASMVSRGLFVLHDLLRGVVNDPPPCVDTTPVPTQRGLSQRAISQQRIANQACGGCHERFEPLAFGLEKFDGLGAFHESDHHGNRLREDGQVQIPGQSKSIDYQSTKELMSILADSPRVQETLTWKLVQFVIGRPLAPSDAKVLVKIHDQAMAEGGTYQATLTAILMSDLVRKS